MSARAVRVGEHRGKPRLWLEGAWLALAGFERGARYRATFGPGARVCLELDADGDRQVSGKGAKPVIDINSRALPFVGPAVVEVNRDAGRIVVVVPALVAATCPFCYGDHVLAACPNIDAEQLRDAGRCVPADGCSDD